MPAVFVVVALLALGASGTGGGIDDGGTAPTTPPRTPSASTFVEQAEVSPTLGPIVEVGVAGDAVGALRRDSVLRVEVDDFPSFATARAMQCVGTVCGNLLDVQFREDGTAEFQYLVVDDFAPLATSGRCRADAPPCSLVIENDDGEDRAEIVTVFEDALPPPGRLEVRPRSGLVEGQEVEISLAGFTPGARLEVVMCAAPATVGSERCGAPGPVEAVRVGADGSATASLALRTSTVGTDHAPCGRGSGCGIAVRSSSSFVRSPIVALTFAAPPGADYDGRRVLVGLGVALVLGALAAALIRRTDWSAVGEEAAPEIDDAEYADLDAIIALLPPEPELEVAAGAARKRGGREGRDP